MDLLFPFLLLLSFAASLLILRRLLKPNSGHRKTLKLPPGPSPLPILGNILELGPKPHQSLHKLSQTYGPLMLLKLGSTTTVVVSSPETARLVLQKHDHAFSGRATPDAIRSLDHHLYSVAWTAADDQWRKLRRICKEKMFSVRMLDVSEGLRREKLQSLRDYLAESCMNRSAVDIGRAAFTTSLNLMSQTLFSVDFAAFGSESSQEIREVVCGIMALIGKPNVADYFPLLRRVDPQGIFRKNTEYFKKLFKIFDEIICERLQARRDQASGYVPKNDMLEALLDLNQKDEPELSFDLIKHLLLDLFVAGSDTTSGTVEWAMAELIRNPDKMSKAKNEIANVIGHNKQVQESDISRLPYLRAVVKETFRLHPTVPLSVPHKPDEDTEINGFTIPKDTRILVNVWAIGRDSSIWLNPDEFSPERFLELETDFRGQHFELIPFGGGRRICVGMPLAYRMVHLMVAVLIGNFDWKLEEGFNCGELDMDEKFGLSLQKAIPLKAVPIMV